MRSDFSLKNKRRGGGVVIIVITCDNHAVELYTSRVNSKVSGRNPPLLYCKITLIAMQGRLHWVVAHSSLIGYSTVQYSAVVIIYDNK